MDSCNTWKTAMRTRYGRCIFFFFQAEDGIRDPLVTGVQTCALPIYRRLLIVGGFGMAATIALVPALHSSAALYAWTAALAFSNSLFGPAATGLVSVCADPTEQGTVLGAAQALAALGRLLGPLVMGAVYDVSHAAAFLVAGAVMALGGVACLWVPAVEPEAVKADS